MEVEIPTIVIRLIMRSSGIGRNGGRTDGVMEAFERIVGDIAKHVLEGEPKNGLEHGIHPTRVSVDKGIAATTRYNRML